METSAQTRTYHLLTDSRPLDLDRATMLSFLLRMHQNLTPDRVFLATDKRAVPADTGIIDTRKYGRYLDAGYRSATEAILKMENFKPTPALRGLVEMFDQDKRPQLDDYQHSINRLLKTAGTMDLDATEMFRQAAEVVATLYLHLEDPLTYDAKLMDQVRDWIPEIFEDFRMGKNFMSKPGHVQTIPGYFIALVGRMAGDADAFEQRCEAIYKAYAYWKQVLDAPARQQRRVEEARLKRERLAQEDRAREEQRAQARAVQLLARLDGEPVTTPEGMLVSGFFEIGRQKVRGAWVVDSNKDIASRLWPLLAERKVDILVVLNDQGYFDIRVREGRNPEVLVNALNVYDGAGWQFRGNTIRNQSPSALDLSALGRLINSISR